MSLVTHSVAAQNAATDAVTAQIGASGNLAFRLAGTIGSPGAVAATLALSATAFGAATGGVATTNAITTNTNVVGNASPVATATLQTSGGTPVIHFAVAASVTTTITGSSGAATITVGSATGLASGMNVSGTGIASGASIVNITGTTVTLSANNTGAVSGSGTFVADMTVTNGLTFAPGDTVSCSSLTYRALIA